ncbi:hypothetical protein V8F33_000398 [Rhypophila sp. PSN 637]
MFRERAWYWLGLALRSQSQLVFLTITRQQGKRERLEHRGGVELAGSDVSWMRSGIELAFIGHISIQAFRGYPGLS